MRVLGREVGGVEDGRKLALGHLVRLPSMHGSVLNLQLCVQTSSMAKLQHHETVWVVRHGKRSWRMARRTAKLAAEATESPNLSLMTAKKDSEL